jgi:hypothetical protein
MASLVEKVFMAFFLGAIGILGAFAALILLAMMLQLFGIGVTHFAGFKV